MTSNGLLSNLNSSQYAAVSSFADTLAILAGPGSGKTHTMTSRTAWFLEQGLQPWNIIVATFTVKAAREMKERIGKLLGNGLESKLVLGTFHSISRRYLARYGHLINIRKDFGIADSADSLAIIKRICKRNNFIIDSKVARSRISGLKARGGATPIEKSKSGSKAVEAQEFELCYAEYESALKISNLLDYDDLLLRCVELLRDHPSCVSNVEAVLIDEFQDTNLVQFDLMRLFAAHRKRITIVGDPDQSIYGFRAAEIKNYKRMIRQYPDTVTIALEENYRSSGAILITALEVIEQDSSRVKKSLQATHGVGTQPVLRKLHGAYKEAEWIVTEIQRCRGMTGDLLDLNDFAILLRSSSLSRLIETALGKSGIAYKMVGGLRFYDRLEVKTILDYLRVINQPYNNDSLARIINTPSRRIGESTIKSLLEEADLAKTTLWSLILGTVQGKQRAKTKLQKPAEQSLSNLVNMILTARKKLSGPPNKRSSTVDIMNFVIEKTNYEKWLEEHHGDVTKARWDNVQELITQATDFQDLVSSGFEDETLPEIDGLEQKEDESHLTKFLANVALASDAKTEDMEAAPVAQVTISTIHAAKGLEWPVVFIPGAYQGSIPHSRAEDNNEERRLLYVAMTRAKALLYMSVPLRNSQNEETTLCSFLSVGSLAKHMAKRGPSLGSSTVQSIAHILRRNLPSAKSIQASSSTLRSIQDDLFPEDGVENQGGESRLDASTEVSNYNMGQQAPKRRKVELGRSVGNTREGIAREWKTSYATTMDRASSFTAASLSASSGFVSAGSHLQALNEQSLNDITELPSQKKSVTKGKSKALVSQGNLMAFFGKQEPKIEHPKQRPSVSAAQKNATHQAPVAPSGFNKARPTLASSENGITPSLANHRLGPSKIGSRPRTIAFEVIQHKRNEYVFLSSSPPRKAVAEAEPAFEQSTGLTTHPPLLPIIRPALTMHKTTMSALQTSNTKKTLGVKRSLDGWGSRKGGTFVPPKQQQ